MSPLENRFLETLRAHHTRATTPRKAVFNALQHAEKPLTLQQITTKVKQADRASIYRALGLFEQLQIVNVILIGWKKHFELAAPFKAHHHHIYCNQCGKVVSINSASLEKLIKHVAEQKGFYLHRHTLELSGECYSCRQKSAGSHARVQLPHG